MPLVASTLLLTFSRSSLVARALVGIILYRRSPGHAAWSPSLGATVVPVGVALVASLRAPNVDLVSHYGTDAGGLPGT